MCILHLVSEFVDMILITITMHVMYNIKLGDFYCVCTMCGRHVFRHFGGTCCVHLQGDILDHVHLELCLLHGNLSLPIYHQPNPD